MWSCIYLLAFSTLCISYASAGTTKLAGPFELEFRRIEHCEDEGAKEFDYHNKLNKVSKTEYAYNGDLKVPNNTVLSIASTIFKKMHSGSWAKTYDYSFDDACVVLKEKFPQMFTKFTEEYLKVAAECPVPAATYNAKNWVIELKEFPMDELEYGVYKIEAIFLRGEERIGCVQLYVDVEEKPTEGYRG